MVEGESLDLLLKATDPTIVEFNEFRETLEQSATRLPARSQLPAPLFVTSMAR